MIRLDRYEAAGIAAGRPLAVAARAMVVAPSAWAATVGLDVLRAGGSAVDAAVAIGAALTVAFPNQCGLGGDAFWLIRERDGATAGLNASGRAPAGADAGALRERGLSAIPSRSAFAVTVPGLVAGWRDAHARFGRLEFARLLTPAVEAAERGLAVTPLLARQVRRTEDVLRARPEAARVFLPGGRAPAVGAVLRQPDLAATLRAISSDPDAFYTGAIAERIARAVDGWLAPDDLARHAGDWVAPLRAPFAGWEIEQMPPNSQGATALIGLQLVARRGLGSADPPAAWVEAGIAAARTFMAIRDREIGDPAGMRRTAAELVAMRSVDDGPAAAPAPAAGDTSHFAIVDEDGLAVSCIQSVFDSFGSGIVVPGTGVLLQSRGSSFALDDDHVNALRPGRRPLHTLAPGMATQAGRTAAVFGCMGGHAQTQIHVQLIGALAGRGEDPVAAVSAPRWVLGAGDTVRAEDRDELPALVAAAGHPVERTEPYCQSMGHAQLIVADEETGVLAGAADPRSDGAALGY